MSHDASKVVKCCEGGTGDQIISYFDVHHIWSQSEWQFNLQYNITRPLAIINESLMTTIYYNVCGSKTIKKWQCFILTNTFFCIFS